jgi:hypothetical protein
LDDLKMVKVKTATRWQNRKEEVPDMELIEDEELSLGRTARSWPREERRDVYR